MSVSHLLLPKVKDLLSECAVHAKKSEIKEPCKRSIQLSWAGGGVKKNPPRMNQYHLLATNTKEGKVYSCQR